MPNYFTLEKVLKSSLTTIIVVNEDGTIDFCNKQNPEDYKFIIDGTFKGQMCCLATHTILDIKREELGNGQRLIEIRDVSVGMIDELTKLFNLRGLRRYLETIENNPKIENITFATIDIDNFKSINDTHGHEVGDSVLISIANTLNKLNDDDTMVCRNGGDEFLVVFTNQEVKDIHNKLESIRMDVEKLGNLTVSIGYSTSNNISNFFNIIKESDQAMYESKHCSKNTITFYGDL